MLEAEPSKNIIENTGTGVIEEKAHCLEDGRDTCNVLVVDDDLDILECYKMLFECEGYCVETASNPSEAMEKIREMRFKLAILDFNLPGMKGDVLAMKLLETNSSMKLIFISGYNDAKTNVVNRGFDTKFFMKPIDPESLLTAARSVINESHIFDVVEPPMMQAV
ncbi:MAG: response regulator [Candidatus Bathyarchaeota archaeon]